MDMCTSISSIHTFQTRSLRFFVPDFDSNLLQTEIDYSDITLHTHNHFSFYFSKCNRCWKTPQIKVVAINEGYVLCLMDNDSENNIKIW